MPRRSRRAGEAPKEEGTRWELEEGEEIAPGRLALKRLGWGNLYETYLAWDDRLFSIVVAKLLRPDKVADDSALRSLTREAESLERLAHPLLVRSFGSVLNGPKPHLLLEHLEGPSLHSLIRKHAPLPLEQILPLALDLCSALHYLETEDMVHLDVKPRNVIMGPAPKLVDLSLARSVESAQRLSGGAGTEGYMAPEQIEPTAERRIGPATDVWGLAVTVFEAISGRLPFATPNPPLTAADVTGGPEPLPDEVPATLAQLLAGCLSPDPVERPRASQVAVELRPLVEVIGTRRVIRRRRPGIR